MNLRLHQDVRIWTQGKIFAGNQGQGQGGRRRRRRPRRRRGRGGPLFGGGPQFSSGNSDRRYNLTLGVNARNVFNNVNVANPNAVLGSPAV